MENLDSALQKVRKTKNEGELESMLSKDNLGLTLELILSNKLKPSQLDQLKGHPNVLVRHEVAKSVRCRPETLEFLSQDKEMLVRDYARRTLELISQN